jgi:hypothetical protein
LGGVVQPAVDIGDLLYPLLALGVLQLEQFAERPVKVIR